MQMFRKQLLACAALAALGTVSLCAQPAQRQHGFAKMATALNLTPDQQNQTKAIFQESHKSARQVRLQLRQTRQDLKAAVASGDSNQIQQLASSEGTEMGQLAAIRATAMSKVYKILTPDQQQKFMSMRQELRAQRRAKG